MSSWRHWTARSRASRIVLEVAIVALIAAGSYRIAFGYLSERDVQTLISWETETAVMFACGYGFVHPGGESPQRQRFITRQSGSISCHDFAWGGAPTPAIGIALNNRYSIYGAAYAMRLGGVSWQVLDGYLAFLYAVSMTAIYGLFRQGAGRVLATFGVVVLACSTLLADIIVLRDFIKLPCFAVLWLTLAWMVRRGLTRGARAVVLPMALGGAGVGLGIGLRMDALILAPAFVAIAVLAVPGFNRSELRFKAISVAAFAMLFLVTGVPILRSMAGGSNSAHVVVLGMMREFDAALAIEPAPYDIGFQYSDGFAFTVVTSHGLLKQGARLPIGLGSPEYDRIGARFVSTMARQFPADVVTRALAATAQTFRFPFDWRIRERAEQQPSFQQRPWLRALSAWSSRALGLGEGRELMMTLVAVSLAAAFNWRLGVIGLGAALYFCGYGMLQYSRRHVFHLDVIPIFAMVAAIQLPLTMLIATVPAFRESRAGGRAVVRRFMVEGLRGAAALAAMVLIVAATVGLTRWWQQRSVTRLAETALATTWAPSMVTEERLAEAILENGAPIFTWASIYGGDPDRWGQAALLRVPGVVPVGTEGIEAPDLRQQYFKVAFTNHCAAAEVLVVPQYTGAQHTFDHEYIRTFSVPVSSAGPSYLLVPGYYHLGPTWNRLDGFAVPSEQRSCVTGVWRAQDPAALPLPVLSMVLPPDWRDRPLYHQLAQPRVTIIGTQVGPRPTVEG